MNQTCGPAGCTAAEILCFEEQALNAPEPCIACNTGAVDTAADNNQFVVDDRSSWIVLLRPYLSIAVHDILEAR